MTLEEASLMEPLGVAVYAATQRGKVSAMENVIVSSQPSKKNPRKGLCAQRVSNTELFSLFSIRSVLGLWCWTCRFAYCCSL